MKTREEFNDLSNALYRSINAFMSFIDKLQDDGHMKCNSPIKVSTSMAMELAGFVNGIIYSISGDLSGAITEDILKLNSKYIDEKLYFSYTGFYTKNLSGADDAFIPEGFKICNEFDMMAQEYKGAFYSTMRVSNPGRLTDLYMELFNGYRELALSVDDDPTSKFSMLLDEKFNCSLEGMRESRGELYYE